MKVTSTLAGIASQIWEAPDLESARKIFIEHVSGSRVKDRDKMLIDIQQLRTLRDLHRYTANALLKFEGLGVGTRPSRSADQPSDGE